LQKQDNSNQADFSAASMRIRYACRAHPPLPHGKYWLRNLILPQNGKPKTIEAV